MTPMYHLGDPCIHCGQPHDDVEPGICQKATGLTAMVRNIAYLKGRLADHEKAAAAETASLKALIAAEQTKMNRIEANLDTDKIALAETVLFVGKYTGEGEQPGARADAIRWFAGEKVGYRGLKHEYFGTKNYDRWSSQRADCEYGFGPSHGSPNFRIGLKDGLRGPDARELTDAEREAAIYYLTHIQAIQTARVAA